MMMPSMVSALRSLFTASARIATRSRPRAHACSCRACRPQLRGRRARPGARRDDVAVAEAQHAARVARDVGLVRDQHDGHALAVELLEQRHDLQAGARVEVAGGLVGEDQRGRVDQRARDRHALLLAAGELRRLVVGALGEARRCASISSARARRSRAGDARRRPAAARRSRARRCAASRLKFWNTKPMLRLRTSASSSPARSETRLSAQHVLARASAGRGSRGGS